jgi:hypothetical protein
MDETTGQQPQQPSIPQVPPDADATQGAHFRRIATHPATLVIAGVIALAALIGAGTAASWGIGAAAAAGVILLTLLVVWLIANSMAAEDFYRSYAAGRGLARIDGKSDLPPLTPLLRKGDRRYADQRFNGVLPGGINGSLCLYTYEDETRDSDGNKQTTYVHFTIVMTQLPATAPYLQELYCQRRFGFRFMDSMEDVFRTRQRVEQESDAVDKSYEIFIGKNDDMNKARQVLSPTFLVWLEQNSDENFAFELVAGSLVANIKGHKKSAADLDRICTNSAAVARRLEEEAGEVVKPPPPSAEAGPLSEAPPSV